MKIVENDFSADLAGTPPQPQINPADLPYVSCEKCEHEVFEEKMMLKKVSKLLTGSHTDSVIPVPVIVCAACGNINDLFKPKV